MRFYRALLFLYPSRFREEYRDELCRAFAERTRGWSTLSVLLAAVADVVPNAISAYWDILRHDAAAGTTWPAFGSDIRFALRQIRRTPLFSGVVIAVIAIGIGINAGMMTLLDVYAWHPAPGIAPDDRLVRLTPMAARGRSSSIREVSLSYAELQQIREQRRVFTDVAGWQSADLGVDLGSGTEVVLVTYASDNYFRSLRVDVAAGTGFPNGGERSPSAVAVIGHSIWMTNFGGSPDAIGKTIRVMNVPFTIIGVAPPRFVGVDVDQLGKAAVWVPLGARALLERNLAGDVARSNAGRLSAFARLARGVKLADVAAGTSPLAARLAQENPDRNARFVLRAEPLNGLARGDGGTKELLAAFFIVMTLIVVITCTNVSALLLGRAVARRREIGVRLSLGATRLRLIRQMLTESLIHALAGALLAMVLYIVSMRVAYATIPELIVGLQPSAATFAFAAFFALATTLAFGIAPAVHATSADIAQVIKNSGAHAIRRSRLQATFVLIQLACSQPVLVVTSLVLADVRRGMGSEADKAPASVVTMSSELFRLEGASRGDAARDSSTLNVHETLALIANRVRQIPGVTSAAVSHTGADERFDARRTGDSASTSSAQARQIYVTPDYFTAVGIPVVRGRAITRDDDHRGSTAVVVNQEMAQLLWPGEDPMGKRLMRRPSDKDADAIPLEVIGVAGRPAYDDGEPRAQIFAPLSSDPALWPPSPRDQSSGDFYIGAAPTIAVRTSGDARDFVPQIRAAIREIEPLAGIRDVSTLAERYASRRREAVQANLAALAVGTVALLLASLGLYAIIAFAVEQRTREIGIRIAMGATSSSVVRHFLRRGVVLSAIGLAIGLPVTVAAIRVVQANVIGFTVEGVLTVMFVVPVLIGVAMLASWLPARRAGAVDPLTALRSE
jgi:predicted permease